MKRWVVVALALLLFQLVPAPAQAADDPSFDPPGLVTTPWVGPEDDTGWHFRVPVTVDPFLNGTSEGFGLVAADGLDLQRWPAMVTLDLERLLPEARWLADPDTGTLASFTLDPDSVRVVEVSGFTRSDTALVQRPEATGMDRHAVPHLTFRGSLGSVDPQPYHASTNPTVSVVWLVDGPELTHLYHIYFDITQNAKKPAPVFSDAERGALDSLFHGRHANVFYAPSIAADKPLSRRCVAIIAQHADTAYTMTTGETLVVPGTPPEEAATLAQRGSAHIKHLGDTEPTQGVIKIASAKPVGATLVVDNDNPAGSNELCVGGSNSQLKNLGATHALAPGDPAGQRHDLFPVSDQLGVARLAGAQVSVRVHRVMDDREVGRFTYDEDASRIQPGTVMSVPTFTPLYAVVQGNADARVALFSIGNGLVQAPTATGRPWGQTLAAPAFHDGQYVLLSPEGRGFAQLQDGQAVLYQGNVTVPGGVDPVRGAPVRSFWSLIDGGKPAQSQSVVALATALNPSRPLQFLSSVDNVGDGTRSVYTPLRGEGGTHYVTATKGTSLVVLPLFPATQVSVEVTTRAGVSWTNRTMSPPGSLTLSEDGGFVVHATKPVNVFLHRSSTSSFGGVLPGRPLFLDAHPGHPEWGGYLVGIEARETSVLVPPGQSVDVPLEVFNLGRRNSGNYLPDKATLSVRCADEACGWTAELSARTLGFPSPRDSPQRVTLTLTPPEDAAPTDPPATLLVTAASVGNDDMVHEVSLGAGVRIRYGVLTTFDTASLLPDPRRSQVIESGGTARYDVAVVNTGDVTDTMGLKVLEVGGFQTSVVDDAGRPLRQLTLEPGAHQVVHLDVKAPTEGGFLTSFATLAATSAGDSFQLSTVTAITSINPNVQVLLSPDEPRKLAVPGEPVTFNVTIVNLGDVSDVMVVSVEGSPPPGWQPANVTGMPLADRVSVAPGRPVVVQVHTLPPEDATPLSQYTMRLAVVPQSSPGGEGAGRLELNAVVDRHFSLAVEGDELVLGEPAASLLAPLTLTNTGNADETFNVAAGTLPRGWSLAPVAPVQLARGETKTVELTLRFQGAPPEPGTFAADLRFAPQSRPSTQVPVPLSIEVFPFSGLALDLERPPIEPLPAGRVHRTGLAVGNTGNLEAIVTVEGTWPDELRVNGLPAEVLLAPGAREVLPVSFQVAIGTPPGALSTTLTATSVGASTELKVPLATEPLSLALTEARFNEAGAGRAVQATVVNRGNATAFNLTVTLDEAGVPLRNVSIARLAPGASSPVSLLVGPDAEPDALTLRLVGGDGQEGTPADNVLRVASEERGLGLPGPLALLAVVAAALVASARRWPRW